MFCDGFIVPPPMYFKVTMYAVHRFIEEARPFQIELQKTVFYAKGVSMLWSKKKTHCKCQQILDLRVFLCEKPSKNICWQYVSGCFCHKDTFVNKIGNYYLSVYACMRACIRACICTWARVCACVHECVRACLYACEWLKVCVSMCVRGGGGEWGGGKEERLPAKQKKL